MGTSATVFRVLMYSVWLGNPGKMLSTVHWNRTGEGGEATPREAATARQNRTPGQTQRNPMFTHWHSLGKSLCGGFFTPHFCIPEEHEAQPDSDRQQQATHRKQPRILMAPCSSPPLLLPQPVPLHTCFRNGCPLTGFISCTGWTRSFFQSSFRI